MKIVLYTIWLLELWEIQILHSFNSCQTVSVFQEFWDIQKISGAENTVILFCISDYISLRIDVYPSVH